jgi:4-hydroxybenzoate polyprenyltransferase
MLEILALGELPTISSQLLATRSQQPPTKENNLNPTLKGIIKLTRFNEYVWFVIVTTCLGAAAGANGGLFGWQWIVALLANWTAVGFAFMINDVEDADDDALNPAKINRNPISCKMISPRVGYIASYATAVISAVLYAMLGTIPFVIGLISLLVGFLYSWRRVRIKSLPFVDLIIHCMMLAGFQFLPAYFAYTSTVNNKFWWPFLAVVSISMYGELFNELRDLEGDLKAGVRHSASVLGERNSKLLANVLLILGVVALFVTLFVIQLIPWPVLLLMVVIAAILIVPPLLRVRKSQNMVQFQGSFQVPVQIAAALAMAIWFVGPWIATALRIG